VASSLATVNAITCTTDQEIAPARDARDGVLIFNDSASADLYVKFGGVATASDYSVKLLQGESFESSTDFVGSIHAIWSAADAGKVRVTEFV
jgi:hypothetical protein